MKTTRHFSNPHQESSRFSKRYLACALIVLVFFVLLFARLFYLQIVEHHFYATLSKKNIINILPIKPERGLIYDRNGVLLANNTPAYSLELIPGRVVHLHDTINALAPLINLSNHEKNSFYHNLKDYRRFQEAPIKNKLTTKELDRFVVNEYRFPGVIVKTNYMRYYPLGKVMSDVVGYVGRISANELAGLHSSNYQPSDYIGKAGIEAEEENALHGKTGTEDAEINARGEIVRILKRKPAVPGKNIYLTIDSRLQAFAEKALGHNSGAIVAIQPKTGQVLTLATNPNYNPNLFTAGISEQNYLHVLDAPHHPLFNRATRGLYAPGSTIKPFIATSALNDGVVTPQFTIADPGWFRLPHTRHIFHDWKRGGHGIVDIKKAVTVSCDTFFYTLAVKLGIKRLDQAMDQFGFGHLTHIDLPGERAGIVPTPRWKMGHKGAPWYTGDTVVSGIGQGYVLVTPLQLALATATLSEHGKKMQPQLLYKIQHANGEFQSIAPIPKKPITFKNPDNWTLIIQAMRNVIMSWQGTAWAFGKNAPYTVAGKTGTAQVYGHNRDEEVSQTNVPKRLRNNHLFICFAPINHPQIALAVIVEHASFADRIARHVLDFYFKHCAKQDKAKPDATNQPTKQSFALLRIPR